MLVQLLLSLMERICSTLLKVILTPSSTLLSSSLFSSFNDFHLTYYSAHPYPQKYISTYSRTKAEAEIEVLKCNSGGFFCFFFVVSLLCLILFSPLLFSSSSPLLLLIHSFTERFETISVRLPAVWGPADPILPGLVRMAKRWYWVWPAGGKYTVSFFL